MTTTDPDTSPTTALDVAAAPPAAVVPSTWEASWRLAQRIAGTPFVPGALRGRPESVLAAVLYGAELGLGPMQSLQGIHVIDGRVAAAPELMRALIARAGHRLDVVEATDDHVTMSGRRADTGATASVTWSMADAQRAGLLDKKGGSWRAYPRAMLLARATSELARMLFADVVSGLSYTPEEVASIDGTVWTDEPAASPASAPPQAPNGAGPDPAGLFERVKGYAGTELAETLRNLADRAGRRLSAADFAAHPVWASVVLDVLDDHERRRDAFDNLATEVERSGIPVDYHRDGTDPLDDDITDAELIDEGVAASDTLPDGLNRAEGIDDDLNTTEGTE
jgi:hypothetical protein